MLNQYRAKELTRSELVMLNESFIQNGVQVEFTTYEAYVDNYLDN